LQALIAVRDGLQLVPGTLLKGQDILDGITIFALEVSDKLEPILNSSEALRIELDIIAIGTHRPCQLLQLIVGRFEHLPILLQCPVQLE